MLQILPHKLFRGRGSLRREYDGVLNGFFLADYREVLSARLDPYILVLALASLLLICKTIWISIGHILTMGAKSLFDSDLLISMLR